MEKTIEEIVELCYQQKKEEAYGKITLFIDEILKVMVGLSDEKINEINEILGNIVKAMEDNDIVAVADLMEYELKEKLCV